MICSESVTANEDHRITTVPYGGKLVSYRETWEWLLHWARRVTGMGEMRSAHRVLVGNLMERSHLEDLGVNGRIILKWIFKLEWGMEWTDLA